MKAPTQQYQGISASDRLADRHARLIAAGIDLFGTAGYRATSIDEVCAGAGLTKRYFYESFASREALLLAVYDEVNDRARDAVLAELARAGTTAPDMLSLTRSLLTAIFEHLKAEPRHARILFVEILGVSPEVDAAYVKSIQTWAALLASLIPSPETLSVEPLPLAHAAFGTVIGMAALWTQGGQRQPVDEVISAIVALFSGELTRVAVAGS